MRLHINGTAVAFIPIKQFRAQHDLPESFGLATLQPKTWDGLGSIDRAGDLLAQVRKRVVAAVPREIPAADWLARVPELAAVFEAELRRINDRVGLRDEEIAFAVNGFGDVCSAFAFALVRSRMTDSPTPDFDTIYWEWLNNTVQVGGAYYDYDHNGEAWTMRVVIHAYGRVGLEVRTPDALYYVADHTLACPAEGYMVKLLREVAGGMAAATV